ncbi:MAG: hypothetical protein RLZZ618_3091, partial [Pseudomonadota bacterium]
MNFRIAAPASPETPDAALEHALDRRRQRVRSTQLERVLSRSRQQLAIAFGLALLLWITHWWLSGQINTLVWAATVHGTQAAQALIARAFQRRGRAALADSTVWLTRYLVALTASAVAWGSAAFLVLPQEPSVHLICLWVVALFAMAGAGAYVVAAVRSAIYLWVLPILAPLAVMMLMQRGPLQTTFGLLTLAFTAMVLVFAHAQYRLLQTALRTKLDNDALVRALRQQVVLVEDADREKSRFLAS